MTHAVVLTAAARLELIDAFNWYEQRAAGLGGAFRAEVDRQLARVTENAFQFPIILADVRRARLRRFPYSLFSRLRDEEAVVIACFHSSRNPSRWKDKP